MKNPNIDNQKNILDSAHRNTTKDLQTKGHFDIEWIKIHRLTDLLGVSPEMDSQIELDPQEWMKYLKENGEFMFWYEGEILKYSRKI